MRTIDKILGYPSLTPTQLDHLESIGFYNGIGTKEFNFDRILENIIAMAGDKVDREKVETLYDDCQQLACRHDIEWTLQLGFIKSNLRLASGIYQLFHWMGYKRILVALFVFGSVTFTKVSRNAYKKIL